MHYRISLALIYCSCEDAQLKLKVDVRINLVEHLKSIQLVTWVLVHDKLA